MTQRKRTNRKPMELFLDCRCGAKARIFESEKGYMAHCPGCGSISFFHNPELLERLRLGGKLCLHDCQSKPCPGGSTTWCPTCRVRIFYRDS